MIIVVQDDHHGDIPPFQVLLHQAHHDHDNFFPGSSTPGASCGHNPCSHHTFPMGLQKEGQLHSKSSLFRRVQMHKIILTIIMIINEIFTTSLIMIIIDHIQVSDSRQNTARDPTTMDALSVDFCLHSVCKCGKERYDHST